MQSILITGGNPELRLKHAEAICNERMIDQFDRVLVKRQEVPGKSDEKKQKASLGIDDVKLIQKKLYLKPLRGTDKTIIIAEAELLTPEAQNALLKVLEEPPPHTFFLLLSKTKDALLPTVLSRCQILELTDELPPITDDEETTLKEIVASFPDMTQGQALKLAELHSKNKQETVLWIEKLIYTVREQALLEAADDKMQEAARTMEYAASLQSLHDEIAETNVNLRLALEVYFLSVK